MDDRTRSNSAGGQSIAASEAESRFSELIDRAEKGETFVVTRAGRPVARLAPVKQFDREERRRAIEALRKFRESQGPPVSEEESQRNYEEMRRELDAEDDAWDEKWISSSTPR
jgi:prevent-host-death family protein